MVLVTGRADHGDDLGLGEEPGLGATLGWQLHGQRRVAGDHVVVDLGIRHQRQDPVALPDGSGNTSSRA
jgi:hypothetical protein